MAGFKNRNTQILILLVISLAYLADSRKTFMIAASRPHGVPRVKAYECTHYCIFKDVSGKNRFCLDSNA
jgi:hypothetical protein